VGGAGGASGAAGGGGGTGGSGGLGGSGGVGGHGGGAVVLAARGLLRFSGNVDVSASAPSMGAAGVSGAAGGSGVSGGTGPAGGAGQAGMQVPNVESGGPAPLLSLHFIGAGGNGGNGGTGGSGSSGGTGGSGGGGGSGGHGVPGMVKLHGSVVLANGGNVIAANSDPLGDDTKKGRYTAISNMTAAAELAHRKPMGSGVVAGATANDSVLKGTAIYGTGNTSPLIPQLSGGPSVAGFTEDTYWNQSVVDAYIGGIAQPSLIELAGAAQVPSVFEGFDQIFLVNTSLAQDALGVLLNVQGFSPVAIGTIPAGATWTTCVPAGASVSFAVAMSVAIAPLAADHYTGQPLLLTATANGGTGTKTYRWLRDGAQVQLGASATYSVPSVTLADAGAYTVEVTDQLPQTVTSTNTVVVSVAEPIQISTEPQGAVVLAGDSVVLTVVAEGGRGALTYDWRFNSVSLGAASQPFLNLGSVTLANAGDYDVIVRDSVGAPPQGEVTSATATLSVNTPLTLLGPADITAYEGVASVNFQVLPSGGIPGYTYQWFKDANGNGVLDNGEALANGSGVSGVNTSTLVINTPGASAQGDYQCVVADDGGTGDERTSVQGTLTLVPHLSITTQPAPLIVNNGDTATFAVVYSGGIPPVGVLWRRDGTPLAVQPGTPVLTLTGVGAGEVGIYDAVLTDAGTDTATSNTASLTLRGTPFVFTQQPVGLTCDLEVSECDHNLTAAVSGGIGALAFEWFFDDGTGPVSRGTGTVSGAQSSLTLNDPTLADSGDYFCVVTDSLGAPGAITSDTATVLLSDGSTGGPLTITGQPQGGTAALGSTFTFTVTAEGGDAPLHYEWQFEEASKAFTPVGTDAPTLVINDIVPGDAGTYYVTITSGAESVQSNPAVLTVEAGLPLASLAGLLALSATAALGGASVLRRRR
jgi:hypothetical protein